MYFIEQKSGFDSNFTNFCSWGSNWQKTVLVTLMSWHWKDRSFPETTMTQFAKRKRASLDLNCDSDLNMSAYGKGVANTL